MGVYSYVMSTRRSEPTLTVPGEIREPETVHAAEPLSEGEAFDAAWDLARSAQQFLDAHFKLHIGDGVAISQKVDTETVLNDKSKSHWFAVQVTKLDGQPLEPEERRLGWENHYYCGIMDYHEDEGYFVDPGLTRYRIDVHSGGSGVEHGLLFVTEHGGFHFVDKQDGDDLYVYERRGDDLFRTNPAERLDRFRNLLDNAVAIQYGRS